MMDYWGGGYGMDGGIFGLVWGVILLVLVIAGVIALVRYLSNSSVGGAHRPAEDILKERYAKGEISKADFEEMKKTIK